MSIERDVYLFKKDGSYEITRTDASSVYYYPEDVHKVYDGNFRSVEHARYKEINAENIEIKTLAKVVNVDPEMYIQEAPDRSDWWRKGDMKWFELVSYSNNMYHNTVECKFEINYAVVRDSPLNSIIESLESINKDAVDWKGKYLRQEDNLNKCISDRNKLRASLGECESSLADAKSALESYYQSNSKPTLYFVYTLLVTWIFNLFPKNK